MINKEIIYRNGGIERDFENKNIPQYSHMQVSVNCLIPAALLQGLQNYAVLLAAEFKEEDTEEYEQRPSLVMFTGKALVIEGIDYIKFMALLPINYTDKVGRLKLTPYIQTTTEVEVTEENPDTHEEETITRTITALQQTFTEGYLIVVKASRDTGDGSLVAPEELTQLLALINSKRIFYVRDYREASYGELLWHIWNDYNPALTIYKGAIIMAKYDKFKASDNTYTKKKTNVFFNCQVEEGGSTQDYILMLDIETREMTKYYNIERTGEEGAYNYSYQEEQVTYNKAAIEALIQELWDAKVNRTQKVNGHALVGDIEIQKGDPGIDLGNVVNYGVVDTPSASAAEFYITAKGVYDYLTANYGTAEQFATNISHLNELWDLLQDDSNNVVDTIHDLLLIFHDYPEAQGMVAVIEDLQSRVAALEHSTNNGFVVIDRANNTDLLTLAPGEFEFQDEPEYEDYPYTAEIEDGRFVGAKKVSVIYDIPNAQSDLLSSGVKLDTTTGKITLYAMERPSENVIIEEIDIINSVAVYQLYSSNVVAQVNSNTNRIGVLEGSVSDISNTLIPALQNGVSDISNTLIPALQNGKVDKETTISTGVKRKFIITSSGYAVESVGDEATGEAAQIAMKQNIISVQVDDGDGGLATIELYKNGSNKHVIEGTAEIIDLIAGGRFKAIVGEHTYLFRTDGKIQIDGKDLQRSNGFYYTSTAPTLVSGSTYRIATANILGGGIAMSLNEINSDGYMLKVGDMVVYYTLGTIQRLYFVLGYASEGYVDLLLLGNSTPIVTTLTGNGSNDAVVPSAKLLKDNLDLKQNTANMVSSFQSTPDNSHYPTEKLIADSLAAKMKNAIIPEDTPNNNTYEEKILQKDDFEVGKTYMIIGAIAMRAQVAGNYGTPKTISNTIFKITSIESEGSSTISNKTATIRWTQMKEVENNADQGFGQQEGLSVTAEGQTYNEANPVSCILCGALIKLN